VIDEMDIDYESKELLKIALIAEGLKIKVDKESTKEQLQDSIVKAILENRRLKKKFLSKYIDIWYEIEKE
jgi:hypothetical protein